MQSAREEEDEVKLRVGETSDVRAYLAEDPSPTAPRAASFEKNYPKNLFIPLIEHLAECGLQTQYEECVGTRASFEGKNVVSLAEIHCVLRQGWFQESINLPALTATVSNKLLMNSKIKKKLFHLLLLPRLLALPRHDARLFKKSVSQAATQVATALLPPHPLFQHPSALIYLLSRFALLLPHDPQHPALEERPRESSKEEYKHYIARIIAALNGFGGDRAQLQDRLEEVRADLHMKEQEVRELYGLQPGVPDWSSFGSCVIDRCLAYRKKNIRITFWLLNTWVQEFKEQCTSLKGHSPPKQHTPPASPEGPSEE